MRPAYFIEPNGCSSIRLGVKLHNKLSYTAVGNRRVGGFVKIENHIFPSILFSGSGLIYSMPTRRPSPTRCGFHCRIYEGNINFNIGLKAVHLHLELPAASLQQGNFIGPEGNGKVIGPSIVHITGITVVLSTCTCRVYGIGTRVGHIISDGTIGTYKLKQINILVILQQLSRRNWCRSCAVKLRKH